MTSDPGPSPPLDATPKEREAWRRDNERFLTENFVKGTSNAPATVDPTDRRLLAMRRDHTKFLDVHSPMKASLWLALLRGSKDVIHDAEQMRRYQEAQKGRDAGQYKLPDTPAIIDIGNQMVAAALGGDTAAIERIAERIEGRVGLRQGDEDPDDPAKRRQASDITERVVRALTRGRLAPTEIIDVESTPVPVIDKAPPGGVEKSLVEEDKK